MQKENIFKENWCLIAISISLGFFALGSMFYQAAFGEFSNNPKHPRESRLSPASICCLEKEKA